MTERVFICLCFVFSIISVVDGKVNNGILDSSQSKQNEIVNEKGNDKKFVENKGQIIQSNGENADFVSFIYQSKNTNIYLLRQGGIAFQFYRIHYPEGYEAALSLNDDIFNENKEDIFSLSKKIECETHRMDMELLGCNPEAKIIKSEKSIDYENHYTHNALNVHHYGRVTYKNVYPNIDWVIYPNDEGGIKYDFVIHPGGDPNMIRLKFTNHDTLYINEFGALIHKNSLGHFTEKKPVSYQNNDIINSNFILEENVVTFHIDEYDVNSTLVIDPDRIWGTYYGGSSLDMGWSTFTDSEDNVYLAGVTNSTSAIAFGGHQNSIGSIDNNAFLVKFDAAGVRKWATYYGGNNITAGTSCTVDKSNNVYLTGHTSSDSSISFFGFQNNKAGNIDAFLVKFDENGVRQWATYFGGPSTNKGNSCAVDNEKNIYLVGETNSTSGISFLGHQMTFGGGAKDAFLVKFDSLGVRKWSTYYGGDELDRAYSCAIDTNKNIYMAGSTSSQSNISFSGFQNNYQGGTDGFLVKFDGSGTRQWATYYGGSGMDPIRSCNVDSFNNVYIAGVTSSDSNIAFGSVHQNTFGGGDFDAYLAKFDNNGTYLWGTYYGGNGLDDASSVSTDKNNNVFISGSTNSQNNISANGHQNSYGGGGRDAFIAKFTPLGTRLWASYYGGGSTDVGTSISVDNSNKAYLAGYTESGGNNIAFLGHQNNRNGSRDAFLVKFDCATFSNIADTVCNSYTSPSGVYTWTTSGTYKDTLLNSDDCDSIITIELIVNQSSSSIINETVCDSFTWSLNNQVYFTSGEYVDTIPNSKGCDSIVSLNLTVHTPTANTISQVACDSYLWSTNNTLYTQSGIYKDTLLNANGCDSIVTLDLTINNSSTSTQNITSCDSYLWPENNQVYSSSGTYTHTIPNSVSCDSVISLNLTILSSTSSQVFASSCLNYTWPLNGKTYNRTGVYSDTLMNNVGCDSIIFLDVHIDTVDVSVIDSINFLVANASNASYQWLLCEGGYAPIRGATSKRFFPSENGSYAVEVKQNDCVDTSACYIIEQIGVTDFIEYPIQLYPNPNRGEFTLDLGRAYDECMIQVVDLNGKALYSFDAKQKQIINKVIDVAAGVYMLQIHLNNGVKVMKMSVY